MEVLEWLVLDFASMDLVTTLWIGFSSGEDGSAMSPVFVSSIFVQRKHSLLRGVIKLLHLLQWLHTFFFGRPIFGLESNN
jgi:hypothetical protein